MEWKPLLTTAQLHTEAHSRITHKAEVEFPALKVSMGMIPIPGMQHPAGVWIGNEATQSPAEQKEIKLMETASFTPAVDWECREYQCSYRTKHQDPAAAA